MNTSSKNYFYMLCAILPAAIGASVAQFGTWGIVTCAATIAVSLVGTFLMGLEYGKQRKLAQKTASENQ